MVVGLNCRLCGRSNTGGNLITYLDELTQDIYMTEDGYVFQNPYWHRKLIPSPEDFELLVGVKKRSKEGKPYWEGGLLHKSQRPDSAGKVKLIETLETKIAEHEETVIKVDLQKFKYKWIFTDTILCRWPIEWKKWAEESTYLLRPINEDLPYWGWVRAATETRYNNCYYEIDKKDEKGKWNPMEKPPNDEPPEKPSEEELDFLDRVWKLHIKYTNDFTFSYEQERLAMYDDSRNYLNEVKNVVKEFATEKQGGTWDKHLKISLYKELRFLMELEMTKLEKHIEKKLDHARQDFEIFLPETFVRVNDDKLMIKMKLDYVYDWWPRTYSLSGLWQFAKRPLTKRQIEEWNEKDYGDGKKQKEPLRTCVFCPSESSKVGDDYAFDNWPLLSSEQIKGDSEQAMLEFNNEVTAWQIHDFTEFMADLVEDRETLDRLDEEQLKRLISNIDKAKSCGSIAPEDSSSLGESERKFDKIFEGRDKLKEYKNQLRQEREDNETRANEIRTLISSLQSQIQQARDSSDRERLSELQGQLTEQEREAANVSARLGSNNERVREMVDVVNRNTQRNRDFQDEIIEAIGRMGR